MGKKRSDGRGGPVDLGSKSRAYETGKRFFRNATLSTSLILSGCTAMIDFTMPPFSCVEAVDRSYDSKASLLNELFEIMNIEVSEEECNLWNRYSIEFIQRLRDIAMLLQDLGASAEDIHEAILFIENPNLDSEIRIPLNRSLTEEDADRLNELIGDGESEETRGFVNYVLYWSFNHTYFRLDIGCSDIDSSTEDPY